MRAPPWALVADQFGLVEPVQPHIAPTRRVQDCRVRIGVGQRNRVGLRGVGSLGVRGPRSVGVDLALGERTAVVVQQLHRTAGDPKLARAFLLRTSLIESLREAEQIA